MTWTDEESPNQLEEYLDSGRLDAARGLVREFIEDVRGMARPVEEELADRILKLLRNYTLFEELEEVASCLFKFNPESMRTQIQYAQALIEKGKLTQAIEKLLAMRKEVEARCRIADPGLIEQAEEQKAEVIGLLGRCYKQLYVDARPTASEPRRYDLQQAVKFYKEAYAADPQSNYWHGVNLIALLTHSERIRAQNCYALSDEAASIAESLLEALGKEGLYWEVASRMEAHLANGQNKQALDSCRALLETSDLSRFALRSTIRQLEELYSLSQETPPGQSMLPLMRIRLAQLPGGRLEVDPTQDLTQLNCNRKELQKVWGDTSYRPIEWLDDALGRARAVARIGPSIHVGEGTGFLVDGAWFSEDLAGRPLLLTNAHICSPVPEVQDVYEALSPEGAVICFLASDDPREINGHALFTSHPRELDATLLELDWVPKGITAPSLTAPEGAGFPIKPKDRLSIIGHPHGGSMQIAIEDNRAEEIGEKYLWYRTPTDPGSSGSPVFDENWRLAGLHHSSRKSRRANEGIRIDRILNAVREHLS